MDFDEFDPKKESYCFIRNIAIPPFKIQQPSSNYRKTQARNKNGSDTDAKKFLNFDSDGSNDKMDGMIFLGKRKTLTNKEKGKQKINASDRTCRIAKRKVTFPSPQNKTYYYNQDFALARPLKIRSPIEAKTQQKKKETKMIYRRIDH